MDPNSPRVFSYFNYANIGVGPEEYADKAEDYARRALALDPDSAEAHLVLGLVHMAFRGDQRQTFHHLKRSLAIRPDDPHALFWLVVGQYIVGKTDASGPLVQRLQQTDPLNPFHRLTPVLVDLGAGRFDDAVGFAWDQLPPLPWVDYFHALALAYTQRFDDAGTLIRESVRGEWDDAFAQMSRLLGFAIERETEQMDQLLTTEIARTLRRDPVWAYYVASICALAEKEETALDWLAIAIDRGFVNHPLLARFDPFLSKLRGQPQFEALMERVKYEWEHFEA